MSQNTTAAADVPQSSPNETRPGLSDDGWSNVLGIGVVIAAIAIAGLAGESIQGWIGKPATWNAAPIQEGLGSEQKGIQAWAATGVPVLLIGLLMALPLAARGQLARGLVAYVGLALLSVLAMLLASQEVIKYYNLEYVLWAIVVGFVVSNTIGVPRWLQPAVRGEFFIKWGLVLLGLEVLMGKLIVLGLPGIMVSWIVTPIVLVTTFWFGQRVLKIESPALNMTVSADMSVCGVSAAIATASACRAKKEELSLAISLSLAFTAVMMVVMPLIIKVIGMDDLVGGAWLGGTIDSTGAVAAAGKALGDRALYVATTVKMIQNILIGVIAFAVSIYWAYRYPTADEPSDAPKLGFFGEVWKRFPKFILGFIIVSIVASVIDSTSEAGSGLISMTTNAITKELRNWLFCFAFVCIGLEMHLKTFAASMKGGKPLVLYLVGQSLNLLLTWLMASLTFGYLFRDTIEALLPK